jgi:YD repeat-containing protein
MKTTSSLILTVWFLVGTALAEEASHVPRELDAARQLLDLPEVCETEYAQVEGTWELAQDTDKSAGARRVKVHQAGKTTVTSYDADGNVVGEHRSEYQLKKSGMARIFVYMKVVPATGPSKGRELPGPFYYAYNVQGDKFIEIYGVLAGDNRSPRMLLWNRVSR